VLDYLQINNATARPLGPFSVLVIGGSLGSSIGFAVGERSAARSCAPGFTPRTDSVAGAVSPPLRCS